MKSNETRSVYASILGILALLMLVNIAGASPFAYIPNAGDDNVSVVDTTKNTIRSPLGLRYMEINCMLRIVDLLDAYM
jgi:hypothetical protein